MLRTILFKSTKSHHRLIDRLKEENIKEQFPFHENRWNKIKDHALSYEGVRFKIIVR